MIPIGTNNRLNRRPTANYILIIMNVVIYVVPIVLPLILNALGASPEQSEFTRSDIQNNLRNLMLHPERPLLHEFITYAFLHGSLSHILGNMFFLWVFGNNVNDRLGHLGYTLLYLGGAVFSGLGHALFNASPVLGASGAVATVTGAYMVLFPKTYVNVLVIFFIITFIEIPALWFILFKLIILDNIIPLRFPHYFTDNIAYGAHLAGYVFGLAIPMIMLAIKMLPRSHFDLLALLERWKRRREFNQAVNSGPDPIWQTSGKDHKSRPGPSKTPDPHAEQIIALRADITRAISTGDYETAATLYLRICDLDENQVLPQQQQLDVANKLMEKGAHAQAARAYELFLETHKAYPYPEQIQLMLGLVYSRYLQQFDAARSNLQSALERLNDAGQRQMAQEELAKLGG